MEHRASPRTTADLRAELHKTRGKRSVARIKNLSTLGLFLATKPEAYRLYESLTITVDLTTGFTLKGKVVRTQENGIAVELDTTEGTLGQAARLMHAVKRRQAQADIKSSLLVNE